MRVKTSKLMLLMLAVASHPCWGWGERGHSIITATAARLTPTPETVGSFFRSRSLVLAHLSNIPDTSWRRGGTRSGINGPTHYFNPERVFGPPPEKATLTEWLQKWDKLDPDWKKNNLDPEVGSSFWRVVDLSNLSIEALRAAKTKEAKEKDTRLPHVPPLTDDNQIFVSSPSTGRLRDVDMAVWAMGVLAHFVGDMSMPYHASWNFDGWVRGHGGIHRYFETTLVDTMSGDLESQVAARAGEISKESEYKPIFDCFSNSKNPVFCMMVRLSQNSYRRISKLEALDEKFALEATSPRTKLLWGIAPSHRPPGSAPAPIRKPHLTPEGLRGFQDLAVERLALSAALLAQVYQHILATSGYPHLADIGYLDLPYPLDIPFIPARYLR